jgi:serine/threonine protein phosphatase 1
MQRTFVIGDIHGCYKTLKKLLFEVLTIQIEDELIFLGDYIDRGPNSKKVVKLILKLMKKGYKIKPLIGNHELMLLNSLNSEENFNLWMRSGGRACLESFKINHPSELKSKYIDFFNYLSFYHQTDEFIIVHGGLNFDLPNPLADLEQMCWIRNTSVDKERIGGRRIIVGHTPSNLERIKQSMSEDRVLLDGGCIFAKSNPEFGYLCAIEINNWDLFSTKCVDFE